jgi:FKBP-type peptidyl-prolyl cis-trans isomerase
MKYKVIILVLVLCLFTSLSQASTMITTDSGLRYQDVKVGTGMQAEKGKKVVVHYTGWLNDAEKKGSKFDSSVDRNRPFDFLLGLGFVIKGWDEGVSGMKIGGKRVLYIPSALGYGSRGAGSVIPPNSDLIFEVELLDVK